jgi:hypothetical protein
VPFISVLISFIGRKIGSVLQAIFGWSITALFGRLPMRRQAVVTVALVLSLAWPLIVAGVLEPKIASWAVALLPLERWFGERPLRIVWGALALLAPPLVGLCVRYAAPHPKGSVVRTVLGGYPLTIGFFVSFIVTAITVPLVKLSSIARGWSDTHVYVQPRPGRYRGVVGELAEACARAGLLAEVAPPPKRLMIAANVLRFFARSAVSPIFAEELLTVRAKGLELIVYPSDLLLRGEKTKVARVRAMMQRTEIDADAWLVASERGKALQDELGSLIAVLRAHRKEGVRAGTMATRRLIEIWRAMSRSEIPYDDWVMLDSIARRVERRIVTEHGDVDAFPLDTVEDALGDVADEAARAPLGTPHLAT